MVSKRGGLSVLIVLVGLGLFVKVEGCDTFVALANATAAHVTMLGKNSDRPQFDAQPLMFYPHRTWPEGSMVDLGRLKIPQIKETLATLGSSPYWCWGYEEGINEYGVAIGNEGVHTKPLNANIAASKKGNGPAFGPTGMDLLRLGLERGKTARESLDIIVGLIEKYGQFGSGHPTEGVDGSYDNSFIIADPKEAYVLETAGTRWFSKRYSRDTTSISNKLGITTAWDLGSKDLVDYAVQQGWWSKSQNDPFSVDIVYTGDTPRDKRGLMSASTRVSCTGRLLREKAGEIDLCWMMRTARDRSTQPSVDNTGTATSSVAVLPTSRKDLPVYWWCASRPSNGIYVPYFLQGSRIPEMVSQAGTFGHRVMPPDTVERDSFAANSYWWLSKDLSDKVDADWSVRNPIVRGEFDALENEFAAGVPAAIKKAVSLREAGKAEQAAAVLDQYTAACFEKTLRKVQDLRKRFESSTTTASR